MQPMITDWLMVGVTTLYLVATVAIFIANIRSVKAMRDQLDESKRQFKETQRLQAMPYLQVHILDGKTDDKGELKCPYATFEISKSDDENTLCCDKYISFENVGLGMLHHTRIEWNSLSRKNDGYPEKDVVIPPHVEWGINARFTAKRSGTEDVFKPISVPCSISIKYEDLLGNEYEQEVKIPVVIDDSRIDGWVFNYITSPKYLGEKEQPKT